MKPSDFERETKENEQEDGQYFDTSEKILALSDALAEEIIIENIEQQMTNDNDPLHNKINYVSLFREKYESITPESDEYDEEYLQESLARLGTVLSTLINEKYGVHLGTDLDFTSPKEFLYDMETLYEFLFIRQYENIIEYIKYYITNEKKAFVDAYSKLLDDDLHGKDIFLQQTKKKFKNQDDVVILHFLNEIIYDICGKTTSAYNLFEDIIKLDMYEEYNNRMDELLINYGNKIVLENDAESAKKYLSILDDQSSFSEIRNAVMISYLEEARIAN